MKKKRNKIIKKSIKVTHINTQHAHAPSLTLCANLEQFYDQNIPHIVKILEPMCTQEGSLKDIPEHYTCFIKPNSEKTPRAAILVSNNITQNVMYHDSFTDRDNCTISIKDPKRPRHRQYINANYMPYEETIEDSLFLKLIASTNELSSGLTTGSDTNARSTLWGNDITNNRGKQLEQVLNDHNLNIENTSLESTWKARGSSTTIDLTITNNFAP